MVHLGEHAAGVLEEHPPERRLLQTEAFGDPRQEPDGLHRALGGGDDAVLVEDGAVGLQAACEDGWGVNHLRA